MSIAPLVAGVAIAVWPTNPLDYSLLDLTFHSNGKVESRGYIAVNDETADTYRTGRWTIWHDSGHKYAEGNYKDGNKNGAWTTWYDNGQKESVSSSSASAMSIEDHSRSTLRPSRVAAASPQS